MSTLEPPFASAPFPVITTVRSMSFAEIGEGMLTCGVARKSPVTFTDFDVSPDFRFWQACPAGVADGVAVGAPELHAASPETRRAAVAVAVRALREVRT